MSTTARYTASRRRRSSRNGVLADMPCEFRVGRIGAGRGESEFIRHGDYKTELLVSISGRSYSSMAMVFQGPLRIAAAHPADRCGHFGLATPASALPLHRLSGGPRLREIGLWERATTECLLNFADCLRAPRVSGPGGPGRSRSSFEASQSNAAPIRLRTRPALLLRP